MLFNISEKSSSVLELTSLSEIQFPMIFLCPLTYVGVTLEWSEILWEILGIRGQGRMWKLRSLGT